MLKLKINPFLRDLCKYLYSYNSIHNSATSTVGKNVDYLGPPDVPIIDPC